MKYILLLVLLGTAHAQFAAEAIGYAAVNTLDGISTVYNTNRGLMEANFPDGDSYMLGRHPSAARYLLTEGVAEVVITLAAYKLEHNRRRPLRLFGHGLMIWRITAHSSGFVNNIQVKP